MGLHLKNTEKNSRFFKSLPFRLSLASCSAIVISSLAVAIATNIVFSNYVNSTSTAQAESLSTTLVQNYENYFDGIIGISNLVQNDLYNVDPTDSSVGAALSNEFNEIASIKTEVVSVAVYNVKGSVCYAKSELYKSDENVADSSWFTHAIANPEINNFSRLAGTSGYNFILSKDAVSNKGLSDVIIRVEIDFTSVVNSIFSVDLGKGGHIVIYSKDYSDVYNSSTNAFTGEEVAILRQNVFGYQRATLNGHDYMVSQFTISQTTWRVAIFENFDSVSAVITSFMIAIVIITCVAIVAAVMVTIAIAQGLTRPLRELQKSMLSVEQNGYVTYEPVSPRGSSETIDLTRNYNEMMARIKELMDDVVKEQNAEKQSELRALQNQINPHFLYNTLDSIIYLIDEGKNEDASAMVMALSKFFRISISKGKTIISLRDEIEQVRNYLLIQKIRYKDSFDFSIDVDEDCMTFNVVKLILQPIAENAIQHGLNNRDKGGRIDISGHLEGDMLHLIVKDNGYGIIPEKISEIYKSFDDPDIHEGVGLQNVYRRLRITYGNRASVTINSVLDEGTSVLLVIPAKEFKNE